MNPRTLDLGQAELFEKGLPPYVSVIEEFSAMHFQIDEPELPEQIRLSNAISSPVQLSSEDLRDYPEPLASALLGLDESVV